MRARRVLLRCPRCKGLSLEVDVLKGNHSAFSGYRFTPSDYSQVRCQAADCRAVWRTKSNAVYQLPAAVKAPPQVDGLARAIVSGEEKPLSNVVTEGSTTYVRSLNGEKP